MNPIIKLLVPLLTVALAAAPQAARAHCDTMDGPVVAAARQALASGELVPLLRWVPADAEAPLRAAFREARQVRSLSPEAAQLADRWFFETVVRLHRAGEGLPYTGLVPAGTPAAPPIVAVDAALATSGGDALARSLAADVEAAVRERFTRVEAARAHADESVERGRELVAAYVDLTHFAEALHELVEKGGEHEDHGGVAHADASPEPASPRR